MCRIYLLVAVLISVSAQGAGFLERLGIGKNSDSGSLERLSEEKIIGGLKEALATAVEHAITNLGKAGGFLQDAEVRIPLPSNLKGVESALRVAGQGRLVDDFVTTMNHAAEQAV